MKKRNGDDFLIEGLKPCPFCGGEAHAAKWEICNEYHIYCPDCHIYSDDFKSYQEAARVWNNRVAQHPKGFWLPYDDDDANAWECSICHNVWQLNEGNPEENHMNFCQNCGACLSILHEKKGEQYE